MAAFDQLLTESVACVTQRAREKSAAPEVYIVGGPDAELETPLVLGLLAELVHQTAPALQRVLQQRVSDRAFIDSSTRLLSQANASSHEAPSSEFYLGPVGVRCPINQTNHQTFSLSPSVEKPSLFFSPPETFKIKFRLAPCVRTTINPVAPPSPRCPPTSLERYTPYTRRRKNTTRASHIFNRRIESFYEPSVKSQHTRLNSCSLFFLCFPPPLHCPFHAST